MACRMMKNILESHKISEPKCNYDSNSIHIVLAISRQFQCGTPKRSISLAAPLQNF
ncbi:Uncharacterized protein BM_BM17383 [Brugia malayi]|uniref:Uncharacterized protein n=1 Tax=Brugia malayi TaxID=6279 RepID=A0A4E9F3X8_BRUMA|nr:Uncharacterized protein BM_BM17383 [Brugia malayi]VIO91414.1 Uncharacterized protein BM_BM17383 [Brugia malayi]